MAINISTHYKHRLTSTMLNDRVTDMVGGNALLSGFKTIKTSDTGFRITPGKCIISGAIIEEDSNEASINIPPDLLVSKTLIIVFAYDHARKALIPKMVPGPYTALANELIVATIFIDNSLIVKIVQPDYLMNLKTISKEANNMELIAKDAKLSEFNTKGLTKLDNTVDGVGDVINIKGKSIINLADYSKIRKSDISISGSVVTNNPRSHNQCNILFDDIRLKPNTEYTVAATFVSLSSEGWDSKNMKCEVRLNGQWDYSMVFPLNSSMIGQPQTIRFTTSKDTSFANIVFNVFGGPFIERSLTMKNFMLFEGDVRSEPYLKTYTAGIGGLGENEGNVIEVESNNGVKSINHLKGPNLSTHPFPSTIVENEWNIFKWVLGDYKVPNKPTDYGDSYKNNDYIYIRFDVVRLSSKIYPAGMWCGRTGGFDQIMFSGDTYNKLPLYQIVTLSTVIAHSPPDVSPRTFSVCFGQYTRDLECDFKIKDMTVINLTREYGKGTEPSKEWCDKNIKYHADNEAHFSQEDRAQILLDKPLMSLPNGVCDEIVGDTLIRRVGKAVLDGVGNNYSLVSSQGNELTAVFNVPLPDATKSRGDHANIWCDRFSSIHTWNPAITYEGVFMNAYPYAIFRITKSKLSESTAAGLKAWLAANPTTVYYELATPVITKIKPLKLKTYDKLTYISVNTVIPPEMILRAPLNIPAVVNSNSKRLSELEDTLDCMILPGLVDSDYRRTLFSFEYGMNKYNS